MREQLVGNKRGIAKVATTTLHFDLYENSGVVASEWDQLHIKHAYRIPKYCTQTKWSPLSHNRSIFMKLRLISSLFLTDILKLDLMPRGAMFGIFGLLGLQRIALQHRPSVPSAACNAPYHWVGIGFTRIFNNGYWLIVHHELWYHDDIRGRTWPHIIGR